MTTNRQDALAGDFAGSYPYPPRFVALPNGRMHLVDEGRGEPILCLHGNPTWSYLYRRVVAALAGRCRVLAPDHLGFGRSDKPQAPYTLDWHIANLTELVLRLDLRDLTLVVHDWGGPIGLGFATTHPERIRRLVLLNTWAFVLPVTTRLPPLLEAIRRPGIGEELVLERNVMVEQGIPEGMHRKDRITPELLEAYRAPARDPMNRRAVLALVREIPLGSQAAAAGTMGRIQARLSKLVVPTAILWGARDPVFAPALVRLWQACFPEAEVHLLPQASHFLPEDAPEDVCALLDAFLRRTPGAAP